MTTGYADWTYGNQPWADYIITQQYGNCAEVNEWVLKYRKIAKPYVNEEYGYAKEGEVYLAYLADVRETVLHVKPAAQGYTVIWINPMTGKHISPVKVAKEKVILQTPSSDDWAAIIEVDS